MLLGYSVYLVLTLILGAFWWSAFRGPFSFFLIIWATVTIPPGLGAAALLIPAFGSGHLQTRPQRVLLFNVVALVLLALWFWTFKSSFDGP